VCDFQTFVHISYLEFSAVHVTYFSILLVISERITTVRSPKSFPPNVEAEMVHVVNSSRYESDSQRNKQTNGRNVFHFFFRVTPINR
jgi:hypothetical protein